MNNLGIQNNRFHQKAIEYRMKTECNEFYMAKSQMKRHKNEQYENWLKQREKESNASIETCLDIITPHLPLAQIPNSFKVKLMNDILNNQKNSLNQ